MSETYRKFIRMTQLPHVWCPGCGNGMIVRALLEAVDQLKLDQNKVVVVSGIGCSGRTPFVLDFNTMHTTHGRALTFASGIKLANPELHVIVIMGDGDASAIGGNHFIHACRRNLDMTALIFNNGIYGLTGGQLAPTTPMGKRSTTSLAGSIEPPFDLVKLALGAGAAFVARTTSFDHKQTTSYIKQAVLHRGFGVVDILTSCPTYFGRMNEVAEPYDMVHYLRDTSMPVDDCARCGVADYVPLEGEEAHNGNAAHGALMPTGIFRDEARADYGALYKQKMAAAAVGAGKRSKK
jgi:2-oxoglutarate ferredoxin oxidoreductase subunit beta